MPKLTTGKSLRGTITTWRPFFRVKRCIGGRASSAGLGGAGAWMRSLRPAQYSVPGLVLPAGVRLSDWTSTAPGRAGGLGAGAAPPEAQPAIASRIVSTDGPAEAPARVRPRALTSCLPPVAAPGARAGPA